LEHVLDIDGKPSMSTILWRLLPNFLAQVVGDFEFWF
jgi:hypothetical protein